MNGAERLKAIIAERKEWEAFGWGPVLAVWAAVLAIRTLVELWTGPRAELGTAAYLVLLVAPVLLSLVPGASPGLRQVPMHGFWAMVAVPACFFGSWAPAFGWIQPRGAAVLELTFLAGGLVIMGLLKSRKSLIGSGVFLAVGALLTAFFPALWAWRPLLLVVAYGIPAVLNLRDRRSTPVNPR